MGTINIAKKKEIVMQCLGDGLSRSLVLPNQMEGIETFKCRQAAGSRVTPKLYHDKIQIFFFTKGTGYIGTKHRAHNVTEVAVFVPMLDQEEFFIQAGTDLEYLNLIVAMNDFDRKEFYKCRMVLPHFKLLKDCDHYTEGFVGKSVLQHSIIEHDNLARISMGLNLSFTAGSEHIGEHVHENLQQWYFGLDGCRIAFTAGNETVVMEDGDCTCIPKKTPHSSTSDPGSRINYVWFEVKC